MNYQYNDGGRKEAGFVGDVGDCTVRAIAIATQQSYVQVYTDLYNLNRIHNNNPRKASPRDGNTSMKTIRAYMQGIGWEWVATMGIGTGCKVHLQADELPAGRIIARCSRHMVAVVDGIVNDTYDSSRSGTRCVYGYFIKTNFTRSRNHEIKNLS